MMGPPPPGMVRFCINICYKILALIGLFSFLHSTGALTVLIKMQVTELLCKEINGNASKCCI